MKFSFLSGLDPVIKAIYAEGVQQAVDGDILVEVGVWLGESFCALLDEAAASHKRLRIVGIDHFRGSVGATEMLEYAKAHNVEEECLHNLSDASYPWELVVDESVSAAVEFAEGSLAMVFLDASHDESSMCADLQAWLPKIKPGGTLAGHDVVQEGVAAALRKLLPSAEVRDSCWVWRKPA